MASNLVKGNRFYDIMKRTDSDLYDILSGITGLKIGEQETGILYIQDAGTKKMNYCYIDKNTMQLYKCKKDSSSTSNTTEYYDRMNINSALEFQSEDVRSSEYVFRFRRIGKIGIIYYTSADEVTEKYGEITNPSWFVPIAQYGGCGTGNIGGYTMEFYTDSYRTWYYLSGITSGQPYTGHITCILK